MEAPNFSGAYPLAGERLAPAWRAAWDLLLDGDWHHVQVLTLRMIRSGDIGIQHNTAMNLLGQATKAGILERMGYASQGSYRISFKFWNR